MQGLYPRVDDKKRIDTRYHTTLLLYSFGINAHTHTYTLVYTNMLTIYLRNYSSKIIIRLTGEINARF